MCVFFYYLTQHYVKLPRRTYYCLKYKALSTAWRDAYHAPKAYYPYPLPSEKNPNKNRGALGPTPPPTIRSPFFVDPSWSYDHSQPLLTPQNCCKTKTNKITINSVRTLLHFETACPL